MSELDLALIHAFYAAFDDGTLRFTFEPEVDLRTGTVPAMTARLQWAHPDRGLLDTADVHAVAQFAGLADQLDQWALHAAVSESRTWHRMAAGGRLRPPRLWVHVGSRQLGRPGFQAELARLAGDRGALPVGAIGVAFTEEALGRADPALPRVLAEMRSHGVAVAVRAFGSWIGSPATLDLLPLDLVRMDDRFLRATLRDLEGESVFAAMAGVAHRHRTLVVADGVDNARLAARLARLGCDRATGPVVCPPLSVDDARLLALGRGRPARPRAPQQDDPRRTGAFDTRFDMQPAG